MIENNKNAYFQSAYLNSLKSLESLIQLTEQQHYRQPPWNLFQG